MTEQSSSGPALRGHSALVTGSTSGIGHGIAQALEAAGAGVVYHSQLPRDDVPEAMRACYAQADLLDAAAPAALIGRAFALRDDLDILISNAGAFRDVPFLEMTPERWEQTIALNTRAAFFLIQEFARGLIARGRGGAVVIVASTNGLVAERDSVAYDTSKGALVMMTRSLALDLACHGIRVNAIAPGLIHTPITARWLDQPTPARRHYETNIPLGRVGTPADCGSAALFLASPAASYITGHVLVVDGGLTISQIGPMPG